jgi:predicted DNA-binding protein
MHLDPQPNTADDANERKEVKARIPVDLRERLGDLKEESGKTFTEAVTEALERYFDAWNSQQET